VAFGRALAVAVVGMQGHLVEVEADITTGLPTFNLVGLPDASLIESRDRVRAATANSGHPLPQRRITVNLSPAALPKAGTGFDLAVAAALLSAAGTAPAASVRRFVHVGELGLDGRVRPVRGVLPAALAAVRGGRPDLVVPAANAQEARLVPGARVWPVRHLADVIVLHGGDRAEARGAEARGAGEIGTDGSKPESDGPESDEPETDEPVWTHEQESRSPGSAKPPLTAPPDLADVIGQLEARRAVEVAAAGGHHLLLIGPPGTGKTLLASRLPGVLPDLTDPEAVEVTAVHSVAGTLDPAAGLIRRPPFESPHHTSTVVSLVGGGSGLPHPGAASRAHRGVLLLDEAAEFDPRVLDSLRQPLEQGELVIHRAQGAARFPARFQLVLATNPCPCGLAHGSGLECTCVPSARRRYLARLSGPLLDRVDLQVEVLAVSRADLASSQRPEDTATVAARVATARGLQRERLSPTPWVCNSEVSGGWLRGALRLPPSVTRDVDHALDRAHLSIRGYDRVLRIAWTLGDLAGRSRPDRDDVGRALMLRQRGQVAA
jgi:magnesium chelatase family protein